MEGIRFTYGSTIVDVKSVGWMNLPLYCGVGGDENLETGDGCRGISSELVNPNEK